MSEHRGHEGQTQGATGAHQNTERGDGANTGCHLCQNTGTATGADGDKTAALSTTWWSRLNYSMGGWEDTARILC